MKKSISAILLTAALLLSAGCSQNNNNSNTDTDNSSLQNSVQPEEPDDSTDKNNNESITDAGEQQEKIIYFDSHAYSYSGRIEKSDTSSMPEAGRIQKVYKNYLPKLSGVTNLVVLNPNDIIYAHDDKTIIVRQGGGTEYQLYKFVLDDSLIPTEAIDSAKLELVDEIPNWLIKVMADGKYYSEIGDNTGKQDISILDGCEKIGEITKIKGTEVLSENGETSFGGFDVGSEIYRIDESHIAVKTESEAFVLQLIA